MSWDAYFVSGGTGYLGVAVASALLKRGHSVKAAIEGRNRRFLFLSAAQPTLVMRAYISVRKQCETMIRNAGLTATIHLPGSPRIIQIYMTGLAASCWTGTRGSKAT